MFQTLIYPSSGAYDFAVELPHRLLCSRFVVCTLLKSSRTKSQTGYSFYIFSQQIYLIIFLDFLSPSSFIPPQNVVYFLILHFLVHKIFTFYINGVLNCKCPAPGLKG